MGWAVLAGIIDIPSDNPAIWRFFAELIPLAVMIVFTIIFLLLEKGDVKIPVIKNCGKGLLAGTLSGIVWLGLTLLILFSLHQLEFTGKNQVDLLWLWVISAFLNVIMQELLVRGYIYQLLKTRYNLSLAVIITTALFTLMHGGAFEAGIIPVLNVITMCLFTTALYETEQTILAPIMAHAVWNITGAIILGADSLAEDYPSLYTMTSSANTVLSGGDYKIAGSIVVLIINICMMLFFFIAYKRRVH